MTSSTTRNLRRYDPLQNPSPYGTYHSEGSPWDRLTQPSVLVTLFLLLVTLVYHLAHNRAASRGRQLPAIADILWDAVVFVTPAALLHAVDRWVNPPLFPIPMLQSPPTSHAAKSDVLRKILRTDQPGGIVASVSQASRRTFSSTFSGFKGDISQPAGLGNWDNSCFQNSVLQGLASLKHLPPYLGGGGLTPAEHPSREEQTTAVSLRGFIAELNDASNNGKTLLTPSVLKNMSTIQQQDAQEYFSKLLDQIDKDIEKGAKAACKLPGYGTDPGKDDTDASQHSDDSGYQSLPTVSKAGSELVTIRNPLEGLSAQRVACTACGYSEGLSMIPFNCLTLNFEGGVPHYDLFGLLDNLVHLESIEGVECVKCTLLHYRKGLQQMAQTVPAAAARLQVIEEALEEDEFDDKIIKKLKIPDNKMVSSTKTKQVVIGRPPPSLVMHMNRSVFDPVTFRSYKNLAAVQFPLTLDLGPWCIGSAEGAVKSGEARNSGAESQPTEADTEDAKEQWVLNAKASMVAGDSQPSRISGPIYELRAVVTHYGRHENGHYVCYRRHPRRTMQAPQSSKVEGEADQPPNLAGDDLAGDAGNVNNDSSLDEATQGLYGEDADSQWWRLSDETVTKVSEQDVLSQGGVFMLFYDCVDPNSVLVTPGEAGRVEDPLETPLANNEDTGREPTSQSGGLDAPLSSRTVEQAQPKPETRGHPANLFGILSSD